MKRRFDGRKERIMVKSRYSFMPVLAAFALLINCMAGMVGIVSVGLIILISLISLVIIIITKRRACLT